MDGLGMVRQEAGEVIGRDGRQDLLDLFGTGEVGKDGWAFDGSRAFDVVAGRPGGGGIVFGWGVEGAEVDD